MVDVGPRRVRKRGEPLAGDGFGLIGVECLFLPAPVMSSKKALAKAAEIEKRLAALLTTQAGVAGVRLGMVNDWGSHTGFSYTLGFVLEGDVEKSDERIDLEDGGALYIERKALWAGEGGLVGATLDIDEEFNLIITPKDGRTPSGYN